MLFGRKLRSAEPQRMLDHINYMQEILERQAKENDKKTLELEAEMAKLRDTISALNGAEEG